MDQEYTSVSWLAIVYKEGGVGGSKDEGWATGTTVCPDWHGLVDRWKTAPDTISDSHNGCVRQ